MRKYNKRLQTSFYRHPERDVKFYREVRAGRGRVNTEAGHYQHAGRVALWVPAKAVRVEYSGNGCRCEQFSLIKGKW